MRVSLLAAACVVACAAGVAAQEDWTVEQAGAEATTIGLVIDGPSVPASWKFAQDYIAAHVKK
jgi:hypothetical protein